MLRRTSRRAGRRPPCLQRALRLGLVLVPEQFRPPARQAPVGVQPRGATNSQTAAQSPNHWTAVATSAVDCLPLQARGWRLAVAAERPRALSRLEARLNCSGTSQRRLPTSRTPGAAHLATSSRSACPELLTDRVWFRPQSRVLCREGIRQSQLRASRLVCHRRSGPRSSNSRPCMPRSSRPPRGAPRFLSCPRTSASSKFFAPPYTGAPCPFQAEVPARAMNLVTNGRFTASRPACGSKAAHAISFT